LKTRENEGYVVVIVGVDETGSHDRYTTNKEFMGGAWWHRVADERDRAHRSKSTQRWDTKERFSNQTTEKTECEYFRVTKMLPKWKP
jgi:hypothetical protein